MTPFWIVLTVPLDSQRGIEAGGAEMWRQTEAVADLRQPTAEERRVDGQDNGLVARVWLV